MIEFFNSLWARGWRVVTALDRHCIAHFALAAVHFALCLVLAIDGAIAHALLVALAAAIYAVLGGRPPGSHAE